MADVDRDLDVRELIDSTLTETQYQAQIIELAQKLGWYVHHDHDSRKLDWRSYPGFPDLMMVHPSRPEALWIEVKSQKGNLTPYQRQWLDMLDSAHPGCAFVARPSDWDKVQAALMPADNG